MSDGRGLVEEEPAPAQRPSLPEVRDAYVPSSGQWMFTEPAQC